MTLTYSSYLKIPTLLDLQEPRSKPEEHDETLFIIIHQTYELWFKQLLHELDKVNGDFSANRLFDAVHTWKRCRTVMKLLVGQLDVLETMTPMSFQAFRDRLEEASGFQSMQFRELEFLLGLKNPRVFEYYPSDLPGSERARARLTAPSVTDHFYDFLEHQGASIPGRLRTKSPDAPTSPDEAVQDALFSLYTTHPDLAILFELMTDFDEGLQEWRYRHVKVVERTIGNKTGTGGSKGVEYLKRSLFIPVFPDLWAIRHRL